MGTVKGVIGAYCDKVGEKREGSTLYRGSALIYMNFGRNLDANFKPLKEAFNGYREEYFSRKDLCKVSTCEGDIMVTVYDNEKEYNKGYDSAVKFYLDN